MGTSIVYSEAVTRVLARINKPTIATLLAYGSSSKLRQHVLSKVEDDAVFFSSGGFRVGKPRHKLGQSVGRLSCASASSELTQNSTLTQSFLSAVRIQEGPRSRGYGQNILCHIA
jgi:hypothetical protein